MKKAILLFSLLPLLAAAQSKIDLAGISQLEARRSELRLQSSANQQSPLVSLIITPESDNCEQDLIDLGLQPTDLGITIVVDAPLDMVEKISELPSVKFITVGQTIETNMDYARPADGVNDVQQGFTYDGSTLSFDGSGVIASLFDTGMDANHVNFKDSDGNSRVQRLWVYTNSTTPKEYTPASRFSNISSFTTDDASATHATHVAGIMAGGYNSTSNYAYVPTSSSSSQQLVNGDCPYYGIATGSDLAFSIGVLNTSYILAGIKKIIDYAESENKPFVVNLSLGSTQGPHDGTDSYSQQLAEYGKKGIICIAAGNDGDVPMSICRQVTPSTPIKTFFANNQGSTPIDIWNEDSSPLTVKMAAYNISTGALTEIASISAAGSTVSASSTNAAFAAGFTGSFTMRSAVNQLNNRFEVYISCSFKPLASGAYRMALIIESATDKNVSVYGDSSTYFSSQSIAGWDDGSAENSINDAACVQNVVSVGSYTTRNTWGTLSGGVYRYTDANFVVGRISPFSSYGKTFQGTQLPFVCAPGAAIVSSMSRYYVSATGSSQTMTASANDAGITNYWGASQGTSMACPYVSGIVALWLQACPTLDYADVMDVINNTSTYSALSMKGGRWGAGKIEARKGIEYILQNYAAIGSVWEDDEQRFMLTPTGAGYDVTLAGEAQFDVLVYDLQGRPVASARGNDGAASVETASLTPGIYILNVKAPSATLSRKITVR